MDEGERGAGCRYTAFLSYSHKDAAAAGRLHRRLETYRMPRRLVGTGTARGKVPERLWPIFRDRDELPAATDLSETVKEALAQSGALIILCSPHSAGSLWVAEEIEVFRRLHPDRPILAAILDGDPPDCFPAALRAFGQDGTWHEPLATDLRPQGDGPHLGLLKLVAGITGVGLDALVQRDAARKIRRVMTVTAAALIAMLVMAAMALVALESRREAERQRAEAERQRGEAEGQIEFMLTDLRRQLKGVGRTEIMVAVNRNVLDYYRRQDLRTLPAGSLLRRARALHEMGDNHMRRDETAAAGRAFREARRTTASLLDGSPNDPARIFVHGQSEYWAGIIPYSQGDFESARRSFRRYKELADRLLRINPSNPAWLKEAAYAEGVLCTIALDGLVDADAALQSCTASLRSMEQARRLGGTDAAMIEALANRHAYMVKAWHLNGRWDRALPHLARHEALARRLLELEPNNRDYQEIWIGGQIGFAEFEAERGQRAAALARLSRVRAPLAELRRHDPSNATWRSLQGRLERADHAATEGDE